MLRLDAERFGTAEYDEATRDGERPRIRRRLALVRPRHRRWSSRSWSSTRRPQTELFLGSGDRARRGLRRPALRRDRRGPGGRRSRRSRYHRHPLPGDVSSYPGALLNSIATAFIDEVAFRGAIFGSCCSARPRGQSIANVIQALLYALTTRLGAPGRDRYLLVLTLAIGFVGGWLDARAPAGSRAAFLGHAITRFAVFLRDRPRRPDASRAAREVEEIEQRRRPPDGLAGDRFAGGRVARPVIGGHRRRRAAHRSRSTSTSRSASRSARTATSWSSPGRRRAARRNRVGAFLEALMRELELRADALDAAFGPPGADGRPALETVYLGGGTPSLLPADERRADSWRASARASGSPPTPRSRSRPTPGRTSAATRGPAPRRASRASRSAPSRFDDRRAARASADDIGPGDVARRGGRRPRRRDPVDQRRPAVRHPGARPAESGWATLDAALGLEPDHLSLYALTLDDPDAEGLTGPVGDHLPVTRGRASLARRGPPGPGRGPCRGPVPPRRRSRSPTPGIRGYEISNWARPGHESRHNLAYWRRRPHEARRTRRARVRWR